MCRPHHFAKSQLCSLNLLLGLNKRSSWEEEEEKKERKKIHTAKEKDLQLSSSSSSSSAHTDTKKAFLIISLYVFSLSLSLFLLLHLIGMRAQLFALLCFLFFFFFFFFFSVKLAANGLNFNRILNSTRLTEAQPVCVCFCSHSARLLIAFSLCVCIRQLIRLIVSVCASSHICSLFAFVASFAARAKLHLNILASIFRLQQQQHTHTTQWIRRHREQLIMNFSFTLFLSFLLPTAHDWAITHKQLLLTTSSLSSCSLRFTRNSTCRSWTQNNR